eukprot:1148620-Pelagomonas_calceolata.AAC.1
MHQTYKAWMCEVKHGCVNYCRHLISIFNDHELELLISGLPDIDVADLRANTEYQGYNPNTPVVRWFFEVLSELSKEDLALMIQFITGTSKVPLEGFKALQGIGGPQKFQIHKVCVCESVCSCVYGEHASTCALKAYGPPGRLPSAHTCFNQLDLPEYESKEVLRERLLMACHESQFAAGCKDKSCEQCQKLFWDQRGGLAGLFRITKKMLKNNLLLAI